MANDYISQITLPDEKTYSLVDETLRVYSGTCNTVTATEIKEVTCPDNFTLTKGAVVFVTFDYTNSVTINKVQLRVNSSATADAKPIKHEYNGTESNIPSAGYLRANQTYPFYYDGTNWVTLMDYNNTYYYTSAYCTSTATTAAKAATISGAQELTAGKYFQVWMQYDNTKQAALTLNVSGKGPKPIYIDGTASSSTNCTLPRGAYIVYYDGTNYHFRTDNKLPGNIAGDAESVGEKTPTTASPNSSSTDTTFPTSKAVWSAISGLGTVTSVQVKADGTSGMVSSNSAAQTGSLNTTIGFSKQAINTVLAGPINGSVSATPTFRKLDNADIPTEIARLDSPALTGTPTSVTPESNSDGSMIATKAYVDSIVSVQNAMVFKGTRDGAPTSQNGGAGGLTPAADCGDTYRISTGGYINGEPVEVGDLLICLTDSTSASGSSNYSTIKNSWLIVQGNVDGAVFKGTNSLTSGWYLVADGTSGKVKTQQLPTATTSAAGIIKIGTSSANAAAGNHVHGNLTNGGAVTAAVTIATNDYIIVGDQSDGGKIAKGPVFDTSVTSKCLTQSGTWSNFISSHNNLVKQSSVTNNAEYRLLASSNTAGTSGSNYEAVYDTGITFNPSTHTISASKFNGNASTADAWENDRAVYVDLTTASTTATINGSTSGAAAAPIGVNGTLGVDNGGTGVNSTTAIFATYGVEYIVGTQTSSTAAWTGVTQSTSLYVGKVIAYKLPYAGTSTKATLNLTLADTGTTTGAKNVYAGNTQLTTHYPVNSIMIMVWNGTEWRTNPYYYTYTNTLQRTYASDTNVELPLAAINMSASTAATYTSYTSGSKDVYGAIPSNTANVATLNPSTGRITIPGGITGDINGNATSADSAHITTTANAVAYYSSTTGTFAGLASNNGALYATTANGAIQFGKLPVGQGGTNNTSFTNDCVITPTTTSGVQTFNSTGLKVTGNTTTNVVISPYTGGKSLTIQSTTGDMSLTTSNGAFTAQSTGTGAVSVLGTTGKLTVQSNYGSLVYDSSKTANTNAFSTLSLGNNVPSTSATAHSEGKIELFSSSQYSHTINGLTVTTANKTHTLPDSTGWIVTGGNGSNTGVGNLYTPVYLDTSGVLQTTYPIQYSEWEIASGHDTATLSATGVFTPDTYVVTLMVTSGESHLLAPLTWTSDTNTLTISTTTPTAGGAVSGYVLTAIGISTSATNTSSLSSS